MDRSTIATFPVEEATLALIGDAHEDRSALAATSAPVISTAAVRALTLRVERRRLILRHPVHNRFVTFSYRRVT
jgi:hypothetical protein